MRNQSQTLDLDPELMEQPSPAPVSRRGLLVIVLPLLALVVVAVIFALQLNKRGATQPTSGAAPNFTLNAFDGKDYTLTNLKGKVVVVNFWASWCGPCRVEAPDLQATWERYKNKDVVFIGIAYTDTERNAKAFIDEYKQTYPNGLDLGTKISALYNIKGVPETFVIAKDGSIANFIMQRVDQPTLSQMIDTLLAQ